MSELIKSTTSSRSWFCVLNSPERLFGNDIPPEQIVDNIINIWTNQNPNNSCAVNYEIGDTGNHHCHMVLCNKNKVRFSTILKLFTGCHIEPTLGTREDAENYIRKTGKFAEKAHTVVVPAKFSGEILGADNNKTNNQIYDDIENMINAGLSPEDIMSVGIKYRKQEPLIRKVFFAKKIKETPPIRNVSVFWHVGDSGTGKTNSYIELCETQGEQNIYLMNDYSNDGTGGLDYYCAETTLFMDEFKGDLKFSHFLTMIDKYKTQIHCRYSNVYGLWNEVHITSVYPPEQAYSFMVDQEKQNIDSIKQLLRRLTAIIYHYKECSEYKTFTLPAEQYINYEHLKQQALGYKNSFMPVLENEQLEIPFD